MFDMIVKALPKRPSELGLLIVVGGPGASGSSTISKMLAAKFNLHRYYGGEIMKGYAKEMGMDIVEFFRFIEKNGRGKEFDNKVDNYLLKQSYLPNVLIESKSFAAICPQFQIPATVRIWLDSDLDTRTKRSFMKKGVDVDVNSQEYKDERAKLKERYDLDTRRFKESYGIDYTKPKLYNDIVIDTSKLNEANTLNLVLKLLEDGGYFKQ